MRPFGPIRGVILRVTGMGGVPVALPVPEEWWPPKWPRLSVKLKGHIAAHVNKALPKRVFFGALLFHRLL